MNTHEINDLIFKTLEVATTFLTDCRVLYGR